MAPRTSQPLPADPARLVLLDLHYTFAVNENTPLAYRLPRERYRHWIKDALVRDNAVVIMTTARPEHYGAQTLARIAEFFNGWQPHFAYFRQIEAQPHVAKEDNLRRILLDFADPDDRWIGLESNQRTRAMYRRYGIYSLPVHNPELFFDHLPEHPNKGGFGL